VAIWWPRVGQRLRARTGSRRDALCLEGFQLRSKAVAPSRANAEISLRQLLEIGALVWPLADRAGLAALSGSPSRAASPLGQWGLSPQERGLPLIRKSAAINAFDWKMGVRRRWVS